MLRNLASALFLTERDAEFEENAPKHKGRITTTLHKAKEVRPLVERCITIARKSLEHSRQAEQYASGGDREENASAYKEWRQSDQWTQWANARAPVVAARRRALQLLGDKQAVEILFDEIAPRFEDRPGGYTRILKLVKPRLGDGGLQAILEFVGENDRVTTKSEKPSFGDDDDSAADDSPASEEQAEDDSADEGADEAQEETAAADQGEEASGEEEEKS
jgi:large subunit ribosomal protein L17